MLKVRDIDQYGFPILQVSGNLDLTTFGKLMTRIAEILASHPRILALDLSEVTRADAAAVSLVATTAEALAEQGGRLRLLDSSQAFDQAVRENSRWLRPHSHLEIYQRFAS